MEIALAANSFSASGVEVTSNGRTLAPFSSRPVSVSTFRAVAMTLNPLARAAGEL
jgi:hypothetical protein